MTRRPPRGVCPECGAERNLYWHPSPDDGGRFALPNHDERGNRGRRCIGSHMVPDVLTHDPEAEVDA